MPQMAMKHDSDPARALFKEIGDLKEFELFNNQLLVAIYIRPEQTKGGIILTGTTRDEDRHQGKVGLVLKKGPSAFVPSNDEWFQGVTISLGEWVFFRPSDGWAVTINGTLCRVLEDVNVKGRIQHPDFVW